MIQITLWIILDIGIQILINQLLIITEKFPPLPGFEPGMFINQISCLFFCLYVLILIYCSNIIFIVWFIFRRFLFIVLWFGIFSGMICHQLSYPGLELQLLYLTFVCCRRCSLLLLIVEPWGYVGHVHEHTDRDGKVRKGLGHGSILVRNHVHRIVTIKSTWNNLKNFPTN